MGIIVVTVHSGICNPGRAATRVGKISLPLVVIPNVIPRKLLRSR